MAVIDPKLLIHNFTCPEWVRFGIPSVAVLLALIKLQPSTLIQCNTALEMGALTDRGMTMVSQETNPAKSISADSENEVPSALPNNPRSPTQSATEGDLVDSDRETLGEQNAPPTVSEDDIRKRAYELWEANGKRDGSEDEFWHRARDQLQAAFQRGE
jgi:hypothetical protein